MCNIIQGVPVLFGKLAGTYILEKRKKSPVWNVAHSKIERAMQV